MAIINDGGGGSTMQMCSTSPFDQQSQIDNLIDRVEELERIISEVLGVNIHADQLSDISQQVGWVYGITFMGTPGWIQTASGSLIPPPGFSLMGPDGGMLLADGNYYYGASVDSDGALQFGFTASGGVAGALADTWNTAAANSEQDYARATYMYFLGYTGWYTESRGATIGTKSTGSSTGEINITVTEAGLYHVSAGFAARVSGTVDGDPVIRGCELFTRNLSDTSQAFRVGDEFASQLHSPNVSRGHLKIYPNGDFLLSAGETIKTSYEIFSGTGAAVEIIEFFSLSIARISD